MIESYTSKLSCSNNEPIGWTVETELFLLAFLDEPGKLTIICDCFATVELLFVVIKATSTLFLFAFWANSIILEVSPDPELRINNLNP